MPYKFKYLNLYFNSSRSPLPRESWTACRRLSLRAAASSRRVSSRPASAVLYRRPTVAPLPAGMMRYTPVTPTDPNATLPAARDPVFHLEPQRGRGGGVGGASRGCGGVERAARAANAAIQRKPGVGRRVAWAPQLTLCAPCWKGRCATCSAPPTGG